MMTRLDLNSSVPHAMIMLINPDLIIESQILSLDSGLPPEEELRIMNSAELQGIKLLSSLDISDIFQVGCVHALYPWQDPKGYFFSLYFPAMPMTKSGKTFDPVAMMLGVVVSRAHAAITNLMLDEIYTTMEESLATMSATTTNILLTITEDDIQEEILKQELASLKKQLNKLRHEIHAKITQWITHLAPDN